MSGSEYNSGRDSVGECLSHLNNTIRELEATVSFNTIPVRRAPLLQQQEQEYSNCPHDYSHVGQGQSGRQSVSRGCPFASSSAAANPVKGFTWQEEIEVSLGPVQYSSEKVRCSRLYFSRKIRIFEIIFCAEIKEILFILDALRKIYLKV